MSDLIRSAFLTTFLFTVTPHAQVAVPALSNDKDLVREIQSLRQEVQEIKSLLQRQQQILPLGASRGARTPDSPPVEIVLPFVPKEHMGNVSSRYVVVEFADLQCPFCAFFEKKTFPAFKASHVDTGKVQFLSFDFPLESHADALKMSSATACAGDQGRYWEMRSALIAAGNLSSSDKLEQLATNVNLSLPSFDECVSSERHVLEIRARAAKARQLNVSGTPSFLVGTIVNGEIRGKLIVGASDVESFSKEVDDIIDTYKGETSHAISKTN